MILSGADLGALRRLLADTSDAQQLDVLKTMIRPSVIRTYVRESGKALVLGEERLVEPKPKRKPGK